MKMNLNLATQPFVNRRRFYALSAMATVVLTLSIVIVTSMFIRNYRKESGMRREIATLRSELDTLNSDQERLEALLKRPDAADALDRNEFLNSLIRQKAVSWTRLFMDLEKVMPQRVQAVSLHPTVLLPGTPTGSKSTPVPVNGPLIIDLEMQVSSDSFEGLDTFVRRVEASPFSEPKLKSEGHNKAENQQKKENVHSLALSVSYAQ